MIHNKCFQLPIQYLKNTFVLPDNVIQDLELKTEVGNVFYNQTHTFSKNVAENITPYFTNDIGFLKDTQKIIQEMDHFEKKEEINCEKIMDIWKSTKEEPYFLEKYSYMEWDFLKYLNSSSSFLQCLSVIQIFSPLTTLIIPIIFLLLPFLMLKMNRIPIHFGTYIQVLHTIAKNHFIGKTITTLNNFSLQSISYLFITILFYGLQIYQNVISFFRFYRNVKKINQQLWDLKCFVDHSIFNMDLFLQLHNNKRKQSYNKFCQDIEKHREILISMKNDLQDVNTFSISFSQMNNLGYIFKSYYEFFSNEKYQDGFCYSIGFEGYIENLRHICRLLKNNKIHLASFHKKENTSDKMIGFYHPVLMDKTPVKNDFKFDKNALISGINASGKTTLLKSILINIITTQQFGCGFYDLFYINPYTHIYSYLNIPDTSGRDSLFQAEARRCKEIIDVLQNTDKTTRHICIIDEIYSGTNPIDAIISARAFIHYINRRENIRCIITTHYTEICEKEKNVNKYMMCVNEKGNRDFEITYKKKIGVCKKKGAYQILKNMDYPDEILKEL